MTTAISDDYIVECFECGWVGKESECRHGQMHYGFSAGEGSDTIEVEDMDFCPKCDKPLS